MQEEKRLIFAHQSTPLPEHVSEINHHAEASQALQMKTEMVVVSA